MAKDQPKAIYVLVYCPPADGNECTDTEWAVVRWSQHLAFAPHAGGKQTVSTAAGDVELRVPPLAERNYKVLGWAQQRIEQLHPRPDSLSLESMTDAALLREALQLSLEYIALAEDGRGHTARSRYLAQQLREIQHYLA
jgi:hypothetical protein